MKMPDDWPTGNMVNAFESASGVKISISDFDKGLKAALETAPPQKNTKPRIAENALDFWIEIRNLSKGVVRNGRILYPVVKMTSGEKFQVTEEKIFRLFDGMRLSDANQREVCDLHEDIDGDRLEVVIYSQPGYASDYREPRVIEVLHSPSGMSWETD